MNGVNGVNGVNGAERREAGTAAAGPRPSEADSWRADPSVGAPVAGDSAAVKSPAAGPRRELGAAVVGSAAGAGLALLAATRTWSTTVRQRPAPLSAVTVTHSGASLIPWMTALALVGLAGAGALMATRGGVRRLVGVVTAASGVGVAVAGAIGTTRASGVRVGWPLCVILGGLVLSACGAQAVRRSAAWPAMGARYDRAEARTRTSGARSAAMDASPDQVGGSAAGATSVPGSGGSPASGRASGAGLVSGPPSGGGPVSGSASGGGSRRSSGSVGGSRRLSGSGADLGPAFRAGQASGAGPATGRTSGADVANRRATGRGSSSTAPRGSADEGTDDVEGEWRPDVAAGNGSTRQGTGNIAMWDALDRGVDPTTGPDA